MTKIQARTRGVQVRKKVQGMNDSSRPRGKGLPPERLRATQVRKKVQSTEAAERTHSKSGRSQQSVPKPARARSEGAIGGVTTAEDSQAANRGSWSLLRALRKAKTKAVNILEGATGIDIDGDGDVGVDSEPQRSTWKRWQKLNRRILKPPTAQQIDIVGAEMEAIVAARCSYVRLEIARRRLIVLKEIKFYGSKHAAGVDTYAEPQLAEQICAEVGIALQLCNGMCYAALTLFMPWSRPHPRRHPSSLLTYDRALSNRRLAARARCRTARARR